MADMSFVVYMGKTQATVVEELRVRSRGGCQEVLFFSTGNKNLN